MSFTPAFVTGPPTPSTPLSVSSRRPSRVGGPNTADPPSCAGSEFVNYALLRAIARHGGHFSVAATMQAHVRAAIEAIAASAWAPIAYPGSGRAEIAETTIAVVAKHRSGAHPLPERLRLVVRRMLNQTPTTHSSRSLRTTATSRSSPAAPTTWRWSKPSTATTPRPSW